MPTESFDPPLKRVLGYPARVAILGALVDVRGEWTSATEVASQAGVSRSTFHEHREELLELGLVERREGDGYPSYRIADGEAATLAVELNDALGEALRESGAEHERSVEEFVE